MLVRFSSSTPDPGLNRVKKQVKPQDALLLEVLDALNSQFGALGWEESKKEMGRHVDRYTKNTPKTAQTTLPVHGPESSQYRDAHAADGVKGRVRDYKSYHNILDELKTRNQPERRAKTGIEWDVVMVPVAPGLVGPNYGIKIQDDGSHPPLSTSAYLKEVMAAKNAPLEQVDADYRHVAVGMRSGNLLKLMFIQLPHDSALIQGHTYITDEPMVPKDEVLPSPKHTPAEVEEADASKSGTAETKAEGKVSEPGKGSAKTQNRNARRRQKAREAKAAKLAPLKETETTGKVEKANPFQVQ